MSQPPPFAITPRDFLIATERALIKNAKAQHEQTKRVLEQEDKLHTKAKNQLKRLKYKLKVQKRKNPDHDHQNLLVKIADLELGCRNYNKTAEEIPKLGAELSMREQLKLQHKAQREQQEQDEAECLALDKQKNDKIHESLQKISELSENSDEFAEMKQSSLGLMLLDNLQFKWWIKLSKFSTDFADQCEKAKMRMNWSTVHMLMNCTKQFYLQKHNDEDLQKFPEKLKLFETGYDHAISLTQELRDILHEEEYLVLPWFCIIHFMLRPIAFHKPILPRYFEKECQNYIKEVAPRMEENERNKCCNVAKSRYAELYDGLLIRYKTIKKQLKELPRPPKKGLLESENGESKSVEQAQNFRDRVLDRLGLDYPSLTEETIASNGEIFQLKPTAGQIKRSKLNLRESLLKEDSLLPFVICFIFGYRPSCFS